MIFTACIVYTPVVIFTHILGKYLGAMRRRCYNGVCVEVHFYAKGSWGLKQFTRKSSSSSSSSNNTVFLC